MLTCSKCGKFIAHPGADHVCESVGAPSGAKKAPQVVAVSGAVVPESDGVGRVCGVIRRSTGVLPDFIMSVTATDQESTAPASSQVPEVTGA